MKAKLLPLWAFYALFFALIFCPGKAIAIDGKIIKIADGDTVTLLTSDYEKIRIRLYGIDTPEKKQPYGNRARQYTAATVGNKQVTVEEYGKDRYGRLLGIVKINGNSSLNEDLLRHGMAWVYDQYCKISICEKWKKIEENSQKNRVGL